MEQAVAQGIRFHPLILATVVYLRLGLYEESGAAAQAALGHL